MEPSLKHKLQALYHELTGSTNSLEHSQSDPMGRPWGSPLGIWGAGIVGQGWARCFQQAGVPVILFDNQPIAPAVAQQLTVPLIAPADFSDFVARCPTILISAGIDRRRYASQLGATRLVNELDLFHVLCTRPTIAVTGSVGKTTVTRGLAHILAQHGYRVGLGGNIGVCLADLLDQMDTYDYVLLEVSSFQLEHITTWAPHLAVWTNFWPNHLDRHDTASKYWHAKAQITRYQTAQDTLIVSPQISQMHDIHTSSRVVCAAPQPRTAKPVTYQQNYDIWHAVTQQLQPHILFDPAQDLRDFQVDAHRLQTIASQAGIMIVNDSKSTLPASAQAALEHYHDRAIVWMVGGTSKGIDRHHWLTHLRASHVAHIITFGAESAQLADAAQRAGFTTSMCTDLETACAVAWHESNHLPAHANRVILFSPAGASFDQFANYQERGHRFVQRMRELITASSI